MIGICDLNQIKKEVEGILVYSQNYPFELHADDLIKQWLEAKKPFIKLFGGKTVIRSKTIVKAYLSKEQRSRRFNEFIDLLSDNDLLTDELQDFLLINKEGFFDNKVILPYPSKNICLGSKLSKSLKKFLPDQETIRWAQDTASRFIQENKIEGYLYLSVDPRDFLTLSENNSDWWSCHSLDGDYRVGNLSYMVDTTTVVAYLANDKQEHLKCLPKDMVWNNKKWRMLIHTDMENCIYYNRQYPCESQALLTEAHKILTSKLLPQKFTFPHCNGIKTIINGDGENETIFFNQIYFGSRFFDTRDIIDARDYIGYCDLINSNSYAPVISLNAEKRVKYIQSLYRSTKEEEEAIVHNLCDIKIGERPICPCCGQGHIEREESFLCEDCIAVLDADENFYLACTDCGRRIYDEDEIFWYKNTHHCKECYKNLIRDQ